MRKVLWISRASAIPFLAASLAVTGCNKSSPTAQPSTPAPAAKPAEAAPTAVADATKAAPTAGAADDEEEAIEGVREHHRHHHHGGVTMFIAMSIDSLGVPPEKKEQLEKIQADLETKMAPARNAERAVLTAVHDGLVAGTLDKKKIDAALAQSAKASAEVHAASKDALNQLHAALSPAEREALVDKVQAHWQVWQHVNYEEQPGSHEKGTHLGKLTANLGLTPEQVTKIEQGLSADKTAKHDPAAVQAHMDAFAKAFVQDKFDAASLPTADAANAHISTFGAARTARFYEVVAPVLTPEQRTKLAAHLEQHLSSAPLAAK